MQNINTVLEKYVSDVAHLNAISSRSILDSIPHSIRDDYLDYRNDPYLNKTPTELVGKTFLMVNKDAFSALMDEKTPHTIKELLILAANKEKYSYFFKPQPIKTLVNFILSIKNDQLIEVTKLREIISKHNQDNQKRIYISQLKSLCDRYVSDVVSAYFLFKNKYDNPGYAKEIFKGIQRDTETFISELISYLEKIGNNQLTENWNSISYIFQDFVSFKISLSHEQAT